MREKDGGNVKQGTLPAYSIARETCRFCGSPCLLSLALATLFLAPLSLPLRLCSLTSLSFFAFSVSRFSFSISSGAYQASLPPSRALKSSLKCDGNTLPPLPSPPHPLLVPASLFLALRPLSPSISLFLSSSLPTPTPPAVQSRASVPYRLQNERRAEPGARARRRTFSP